ncbi:hypothetical protein MXM51_22785 [Pantoea stewartii]|uniref:hypothetical protein n=1 Tax=Pantoea stewartii TaxID=66269 RepID=UPI002DBD43F9|nr:hypothetical protein [Pantoea stewartii]MEB6537339.1 hypothetical protein [Pantoea stewartii]
MKTVIFAELDKSREKLRSGKYEMRVESWESDEQIGKRLRHYLNKSEGAPVTVVYDVITEDMMTSLSD